MLPNKVRLEICGAEYIINTSEEPAYVKSLAYEIEDFVNSVMDANQSTGMLAALILCSLTYVDKYKKGEETADHIRTQLTEYLEDSARSRIELEEAKRELDHVRRELAASEDLKREVEYLRKELAAAKSLLDETTV